VIGWIAGYARDVDDVGFVGVRIVLKDSAIVESA
jgi:hypothetical protein